MENKHPKLFDYIYTLIFGFLYLYLSRIPITVFVVLCMFPILLISLSIDLNLITLAPNLWAKVDENSYTLETSETIRIFVIFNLVLTFVGILFNFINKLFFRIKLNWLNSKKLWLSLITMLYTAGILAPIVISLNDDINFLDGLGIIIIIFLLVFCWLISLLCFLTYNFLTKNAPSFANPMVSMTEEEYKIYSQNYLNSHPKTAKLANLIAKVFAPNQMNKK